MGGKWSCYDACKHHGPDNDRSFYASWPHRRRFMLRTLRRSERLRQSRRCNVSRTVPMATASTAVGTFRPRAFRSNPRPRAVWVASRNTKREQPYAEETGTMSRRDRPKLVSIRSPRKEVVCRERGPPRTQGRWVARANSFARVAEFILQRSNCTAGWHGQTCLPVAGLAIPFKLADSRPLQSARLPYPRTIRRSTKANR